MLESPRGSISRTISTASDKGIISKLKTEVLLDTSLQENLRILEEAKSILESSLDNIFQDKATSVNLIENSITLERVTKDIFTEAANREFFLQKLDSNRGQNAVLNAESFNLLTKVMKVINFFLVYQIKYYNIPPVYFFKDVFRRL